MYSYRYTYIAISVGTYAAIKITSSYVANFLTILILKNYVAILKSCEKHVASYTTYIHTYVISVNLIISVIFVALVMASYPFTK